MLTELDTVAVSRWEKTVLANQNWLLRPLFAGLILAAKIRCCGSLFGVFCPLYIICGCACRRKILTGVFLPRKYKNTRVRAELGHKVGRNDRFSQAISWHYAISIRWVFLYYPYSLILIFKQQGMRYQWAMFGCHTNNMRHTKKQSVKVIHAYSLQLRFRKDPTHKNKQ